MTGVLARRLRDLRRLQGMTLMAAAALARVTKGYLSKLETGHATPSIAVLARLGEVYGVPLSDLLDDGNGAAAFSLVRAGERRRVDRGGRELGYVFEAVSFRKSGRAAEAFFLTLPPLGPDDPHPTFRHFGEEIFVCLGGRIRFVYGTETVILAPGDTLQFDASVEHRGEAHGGRPARAFAVILPSAPADQTSAAQGGPLAPAHAPKTARPRAAAARDATRRTT